MVRIIWSRRRFKLAAILTICSTLQSSTGAQVAVRHTEGLVHGFLSLSAVDGTPLATGDLVQTARGSRVTSRLIFHFKDGSVHDETAIFLQRQTFRLLSDHVVQKGPSFPRPLDMSIDAVKGQVTVRYSEDGEQKVETERIEAGSELANGLILMLLKNANPKAPPKALAYVAATPKPRLVKLAITSVGEEPFSTGGASRKAIHYVLKVEIGGVAGVVAPLVGKQPPDSHVWILGGTAPAFVKSEQPFYDGGPLWRVELVSPAWPRGSTDKR